MVVIVAGSPFARAFGKRLRAFRIAEGYESARSLADAMGMEENTLTMWERGHRMPKLDTFMRLCQFLKTDPNSLLIGRTQPEHADQPPPVTELPRRRRN